MRDAAERARRASNLAAARAAFVGACAASALFWLSGARTTRRALGWFRNDDVVARRALIDARASAYACGTAAASSSGWTLADVARALERGVGDGTTSNAWGTERPRRDDDASGVDRASLARFVATHHKTGTALTRDVLDTVARGWSYAFFDAREAEDREATNASQDEDARRSFHDADVVFDYHFGKAVPRYLVSDELERSLESVVSLARAREYRIVHVVRNPVDVIVSGLTYHRRMPLDEKWLTSVREELRGRTYADVLASATPAEAVAAEISFSDDELRMLVLTYIECELDDWCLNIRLEDLEVNFDLWIGRALRFLKLPSKDIDAMVRASAEHDVGRWSEDELQKNEHFTKREDRAPYYAAIRSDAGISTTLERLQKAMNYTRSTGNDELTA